jgi:hypothetical protein
MQAIKHHPKVATSLLAGVSVSYLVHRVKHCFVHKCALYGRSWQYTLWHMLGGRLNKDSREARLALFKNVVRNNIALVQRMLNDGIDMQDTGILDGNQTTLHEATRLGYSAMAKILIAHGANIDAQNVLGQTPLHIAAMISESPNIQQNRMTIARILIGCNALRHVKDIYGYTPRTLAETCGNSGMVELIDSAR